MADTVKIQLQGSILNSLAQKTTSIPSSAPSNSMPNSLLSQNITTGNTSGNNFDSTKITSALATISNKIEKGFMQTVSVLSNMQIALSSRLETINRHLQKLNELMGFLYDTQIKQMKQRTEGTLGLRITEILDKTFFKSMIKFREQLIEPVSREAINMAVLRLVMNNPELRRLFGYQTQEHLRRQRTATFTYELYQTILNIPTFMNKVGSDIINYFAQHHKSERDHWKVTEWHLGELLACCLAQNANSRTFERQYTKKAAAERKESLEKRFKSIDKNMEQVALYNKESKKYEIQSINIFEKLLENTITIGDSLLLITTKIFLDPKGIVFKVLKTVLSTMVFSKIVRAVLSQLPRNILTGAADIGKRIETFFKINLTKLFSKVLPSSIKDGFLSTTKVIWDNIKNMSTMLFSTDDKKRKEATSIFLNQLQTILHKLFVRFVLPITNAIVGFMLLKNLMTRFLSNTPVENIPIRKNRTFTERIKGIPKGHPLLTREEAQKASFTQIGKSIWQSGRRTLNTRTIKNAYTHSRDYVKQNVIIPAATTYYQGGAMGLGTAAVKYAAVKTGQSIMATPKAIMATAKAVMATPAVIKSMAGTVSSLFRGVSRLLITGGTVYTIVSLVTFLIKNMISSYKESGKTTMGSFIGSIFDSLIDYMNYGFSWILTKGPAFIGELLLSVGQGIVKIFTSLLDNVWFLIQKTWYASISKLPGLDYSDKINQLNIDLAQKTSNALTAIEENEKKKLKEQQAVQQDTTEEETFKYEDFIKIVDRIKNYFVGGEFVDQLTKTAEMLGSTISQIAGIISTGLTNLKDASTGIIGNFAQVSGGFLKGLVGETDATGILDSAIAYAKSRNWHGAAAILSRSKESVLGSMANAAGTQVAASEKLTAAADTQLLAASINEKTAEINLQNAKTQEELLFLLDLKYSKEIEETNKNIQDTFKNPYLSTTRRQNYIPQKDMNMASLNDQIKYFVLPNTFSKDKNVNVVITTNSQQNAEQLNRLTKNTPNVRLEKATYNRNNIPSMYTANNNTDVSQDPLLSLSEKLSMSSLLDSDMDDVYFDQNKTTSYTSVSNAKNRNTFFGLPPFAKQTSEYKEMRRKATGGYRYHWGLDFGGMREGTPIIAPKKGKVLISGWFNGYGNSMAIHYPELHTILKYAHLNSTNVRPGTIVEPGTVIGTIGSTGGNYNPHLHLEAIKETTPPSQIYNKSRYSDITLNPNQVYNEYNLGMKTGLLGRTTSFLSKVFNPAPPESMVRPQQVEAHVVSGGGGNTKESEPGNVVINVFDTKNVNSVAASNTSTSSEIPEDTNLLALFMIGMGF